MKCLVIALDKIGHFLSISKGDGLEALPLVKVDIIEWVESQKSLISAIIRKYPL